MNVLVTSSRMPAALDEIRKFGACGHRVFAADTLRSAPGSHSRFVEDRFRFAPPQHDPWTFVAEVRDFVLAHDVELVVPCSEEVFYLSQCGATLAEATRVFAAPFEALRTLHNKASFHALARDLGVDVPPTRVVTDEGALARAIIDYPVYVARPVWSRGATRILSNAASFPHSLRLADCHPTERHPWLVQEFVEGTDLCSVSIARHGRLTAHAAYVHPRTFDGGGGVVFESVDEPRSLEVARRVAEATSFHGHLAFDFRRGGGRLYALECNPRPTAGVHFLAAEALVDAIVGPVRAAPVVAPAGRRSVISGALLRDMVVHHKGLRQSLFYLRESEDLIAPKGDVWPGVVQLFSYAHVLAHRLRHHAQERRGTSMIGAFFDGVIWDGEPMPPPPPWEEEPRAARRGGRARPRHGPRAPLHGRAQRRFVFVRKNSHMR